MRIKKIIVGFPKCGQVSLIRWMKETYLDDTIIKKDELVWNRNGPHIFEQKYGLDAEVIFIERDPIERMWSSYNYFEFTGQPPIRKQFTFPQYLKIKGYEHHLGEMNPVSQSNYAKWKSRWSEFKSITYQLETIRVYTDFPHENITEDVRNEKYVPMPEQYRKLADNALKQEVREQKKESWSVDYMI